MSKKNVMISIDEQLHNEAKGKIYNLSRFVEDALHNALLTKQVEKVIKDATIIYCTQCMKIVDEGYVCREKKMVLCKECQEKHSMSTCPHDIEGMHEHIKFPNINHEVVRDAKKISDDQQNYFKE